MQQSVIFPSGTVDYWFQSSVEELLATEKDRQIVFVTNEHIAKLYARIFRNYPTLVIPPGENTKDLHTIESLTRQLVEKEATRKTLIIGVGGGVIRVHPYVLIGNGGCGNWWKEWRRPRHE